MSRKNKNLVIVRAVTEQGLTHAQAAARFGVTRQWVHTLVSRYQRGGPDAVGTQSRAPRRRPVTTPEPVQARIIQLRHELTADGADAGPVTIGWHLEHEGITAPSTSTIRRILHAHGLVVPEPKKRPKSSYIRFQADLPNECWQADITHGFLADGTRVEILDFLDDHSRHLLHLRTAHAFTGSMVVDALNTLITTHGAPASTLTDNGLVFTARLAGRKGGRNGFEKLLEAHRITQKNGKPGHPQTQGKIERFHQTLKRWLNARPRPENINALQQLLDEFRTWYNTSRPHRATGRRTPADAYTALPKATPHTDHEPEWRTRTDKVDNHGKISLRYAGKLRHLGIGRAHIGTNVLMLIHDTKSQPQTPTPARSSPAATTNHHDAEPAPKPNRDPAPSTHANPQKNPEPRHRLSTMSRLRTVVGRPHWLHRAAVEVCREFISRPQRVYFPPSSKVPGDRSDQDSKRCKVQIRSRPSPHPRPGVGTE